MNTLNEMLAGYSKEAMDVVMGSGLLAVASGVNSAPTPQSNESTVPDPNPGPRPY